MSQKNDQTKDSDANADAERATQVPKGGLNEEVGELEPESAEEDDSLPGKVGGGLAGG